MGWGRVVLAHLFVAFTDVMIVPRALLAVCSERVQTVEKKLTGAFYLSEVSFIRSRADALEWVTQQAKDIDAGCKVRHGPTCGATCPGFVCDGPRIACWCCDG